MSDETKVYLNGRLVPRAEACVPVMDRGFLFGDSVYEVIPVYGGHLFRLEHHLDRLESSLGAIRMATPLSREAWRAVLVELGKPDDAVPLLEEACERGGAFAQAYYQRALRDKSV